jgi:membrane protease YdiL (CAAX protease family)
MQNPSPASLKMDAYLDLARQGKNGFWRYVLAVILILFMWQIIGAVPYIMLLFLGLLKGQVNTVADAISLPGVDPIVNFLVMMLASMAFLVGIWLAMRFIHNRRVRTLITPARSISWRRLLQGFALWFLLVGLGSGLEAWLYPGRYSWTFHPDKFIPFAIAALLLVPLQTSTEELFFRGYVLQGAGLFKKNIWLLSGFSGFLFMMPHFLNPEASSNYLLMGLYYFAMGAFLAYITLRDGRLELALGVHAANNLFSVLVANYEVSALPSPSILTVNVLDPVFSVPVAVACMAVFIASFLASFRQKEPISLPVSPQD